MPDHSLQVSKLPKSETMATRHRRLTFQMRTTAQANLRKGPPGLSGNFMKRRSSGKSTTQLPARYRHFEKSYPAVLQAVDALGEATQSAGPLDAKARALVKLAIAIGAGREGAVHSHTRRALEAGCVAAEVRHVGVLATTTIGFPSAMAALSWVEDVLARK